MRLSAVLFSVVTVTALAVWSALMPTRMLLFGTVAIGPALAAAAALPSVVLLVGGYAFAAALAVSTAEGLFGTADQWLRLAFIAWATAVSWGLAVFQRRAQRSASGAARERQVLAAVAEQSGDAIISTSLDGTIVAWNGGATRMYGWPAAEVIGRSLAEILPDDRGDELQRALGELAAGRRLHLDESRRVRRDGTPLLICADVWPIRDENGVVVAAAATERDITEEKLARERSARADRLESLGQLAGGIAHDFNNLLAIILNYADFLDGEVSGEAAEDLRRIRNAADRAKELTGQLLVFAKREPTQVEVIDLNQVVTEAGELLSRTIGENVRLVNRPSAAPMPVRANRARLDQILLNLVINARDAMPDGGVVVVETDLVEVGEGPAAPLPPGRYARLTVSDTGCGMTAEVRDRLFEPFFTTKPPDRGTGLGLATVYGIVGDAGGTIGVESAPGVGTTFRILLPSAAVPAGASPGPSQAELAHGHGELVLVVEDDEFVRDLVIRILRDNGYRATALGDGPLAALDLHDVALVITDVVQPGRSGPALAARLRARRPDLRVLFISGYSDADVRREHRIEPEARIVQKPFTAVELLAGVGEALAAAHANGA
ncbi:histidine kinase [Actinoplanes sp. SE50]|uniref:hybrid sensor histidine kinase/response regulator n=1 Tax=unclassified Actinoplanes TaxID=2626549 RepID=UPI00023EC78A|nr:MULTISPECIES: PAS domain-containing sensor histidine kinase [unclassified Actinoplanes]AEV83668.1 multi-sensor hybrid histidine kinase [Actinoplanes sp. SE50/110]ATO82188.1 histidine kinase [Actinoplanes sp. SE50]SLL99595.1 hybrid sensor histidine kinase/response regulator [Actinoplanes sp. SE50/110]